MHVKFGQRGVAIVGPACHLISYIVFSVHPPYPVLVVMFIFVGFGNGLIDAAWCAWIGNMANSNEVSGFLQACYALGATVAPLIATAMISKGGLGWYAFYYIMVSLLVFVKLGTDLSDRRSSNRAHHIHMDILETDRSSVSARESPRSKFNHWTNS